VTLTDFIFYYQQLGKEEIEAFKLAYFENICNDIDTENGLKFYIRNTLRHGIVPDVDKDVRCLICIGGCLIQNT